MAIIPVTKDDVENFTIITTPARSYSSGSNGITGSISVYPRQSRRQKSDNYGRPTGGMWSSLDTTYSDYLRIESDGVRGKRLLKKPIDGDLTRILSTVNSLPKKSVDVVNIERFTPTTRFTKYTLCKNNIKNVLMPHYRVEYPHAHWAYTNYHALNFFTAYSGSTALFPTASVLLYPNTVDNELPGQSGHVSGSYCLTGAFSFDFYINPRYKTDGIDPGHFKDGTIFHLSSSYALSLVTGTLKDNNGKPEGFRLKLQLKHSTDFSPSSVNPGNYPYDLVFLSNDNSLLYNKWHHVVVRWGTNLINQGTGSFIIDGDNRGNFVIPSGTIIPKETDVLLNPDVLCIGNFYEGNNLGGDAQSLFFSPNPARRDGVDQLTSLNLSDEPAEYHFNHPLKAEIHDLSFKRYYMSDAESEHTGSTGLGTAALVKKNIAFYLPPFFIEDSPVRRFTGDHGGILQTPFFEIDGTTDDPFNVAMAFGVNGHYINLENFVKDFSTGRFPRLLNLTASTINYTTDALEANYFLYKDSNVAKRNLTILPCDDGNFSPNYSLLSRERFQNKYFDTSGNADLSYINLDDLVTTASLRLGQLDTENTAVSDYIKDLIGPNDDQPGLPPGRLFQNYIAAVTSSLAQATDDYQFDRGIQKGVPLTILQRLLDPSSNQVTIFNISNLYYGSRILPGSFMIKDTGISGSQGSISITLKDDGLGSLYRADALTPHNTQNSVGNIFYDEGIVLIKSPHLYFFGKNQYEMSFKGIRNVYTTKYEILAGPNMLNSSSNPTYADAELSGNFKPSSSPVDNEAFVYINGLYFHDENMNVVAKAKLAQPVIKREGDRVLFKVTFDF